MSRIGKVPITVPAAVKVKVEGQHVVVEGQKGKLEFNMPKRTGASLADGKLVVSRDGDDAQAKALHGLTRSILNNFVKGVSEGYRKKLEIQGVGFKAQVQGKQITMNLGYSHPIVYQIPEQIKVTVEENTKIIVEGPDKQVVGQVAAELRSYYPPEPYKGKGVRYSDEKVLRKEGKTVQQ
jgi:large subunit ribosomal protein L6